MSEYKKDINEFKIALESLNVISDGNSISESQVSLRMNTMYEKSITSTRLQIKKLFDEIDADEDGNIDYQEFLKSFRLVDVDPKSSRLHASSSHSSISSNSKPLEKVQFHSEKALPLKKEKDKEHKEHSKEKKSKKEHKDKEHSKERSKEGDNKDKKEHKGHIKDKERSKEKLTTTTPTTSTLTTTSSTEDKLLEDERK